jgi:hypothetical protein
LRDGKPAEQAPDQSRARLGLYDFPNIYEWLLPAARLTIIKNQEEKQRPVPRKNIAMMLIIIAVPSNYHHSKIIKI